MRKFSRRAEHRLHQIFEFSLLAKGLFATVELLSGLAVYWANVAWVTRTIRWLAENEIIEDSGDRVAGWLMSLAQGYSVSTQHFWGWYLAVHGVVKLAVVAGLAFRLLWAYPVSMMVLAGFIVYQLDRFHTTHSPFLIALTIFDLVVIWLVWHEYRNMKARHA